MISSQERSIPSEYKQIEYAFTARPTSVDVVREAMTINCQTFVHRFYFDQFGAQIPLGMWSKEIAEDTQLVFRDVSLENESLVYGDVVAFIPKKIPEEYKEDPKKILHLTVYLGKDESGTDTFMHANSTDNGVSLWTLEQFQERYEGVRVVKRLQEELHQVYIQPFLREKAA